MGGSTVVIGPPDGDMTEYLQSLRRLRQLDPGLASIAPGHGSLLTDPVGTIDGLLAHRRLREELVAESLVAVGRATVDELLPVVYADVVREELLPVARRSLWAHLRKLGTEGRARSADPDDIESAWSAVG
jgi:glyoxylase-like metal-dependent hydrolase (beta-lactamase superfamily II)